jgi:hypothetical protein
MKKKVIFTLGVLVLFLGSFMVYQPASAQTVHCSHILRDEFGCDLYDCPNGCVIVACGPQGATELCDT